MEVEPQTVLTIVGVFFASMILYRIYLEFVDAFSNESAKTLLSSGALLNGLILALGLSPLGVISEGIVDVFPSIPPGYQNLVASLLGILTLFNLVIGTAQIYEKAELLGAIAFWIAFIGGILIPFAPAPGIAVVFFAMLVLMVSPTTHW